jgi:hypothetical protein
MFRRVSFADPVSCIQKTARFVMPIMSKSCGDLQASAGLRGQYDDHLRGFRGKGIASHWNWWSLTGENPKTPPLARREEPLGTMALHSMPKMKIQDRFCTT